MITVPIKDDFQIGYSADVFSLESGLTVITGCNGAGKSTLIRQIKKGLEEQNISCVYLDCSREFYNSDLETASPVFQVGTILQQHFSSEHEHYENMFSDWVCNIRPSDKFKGKKFAIMIDGLDSGSDVIFLNNHIRLFKTIIDDAMSRDIEIYLVITCNNFHYLSQLTIGRALFVPHFRTVKLPVYKLTEYDKYFIDIRQCAKDRGFDL